MCRAYGAEISLVGESAGDILFQVLSGEDEEEATDQSGSGGGGHGVADGGRAEARHEVVVERADEERAAAHADEFGNQVEQRGGKRAHADFNDGVRDADDRSDVHGAGGGNDGKTGESEGWTRREEKQERARTREHGTDGRDVE